MPDNSRPTNAFETRSIQSYFQGSHLAKIRYACVRAVELDERVAGGAGTSDYFLACLEVSNAIRLELGLAAVAAVDSSDPVGIETVADEATAEVSMMTTSSVETVDEKVETETEPRGELIFEIGFPETAEELNDLLSKKKIVAVLKNEDNADIVADLRITTADCEMKKADLIKYIYTGEK